MSSFGKKIGPKADRRQKSRRREVIADGCAVTLTNVKPCLIEDLSPDGARLAGRDLPAVGSDLLLRSDDLTALARVKWSRGNERGIVFDEGGPSAVQCLAMQLKATALPPLR